MSPARKGLFLGVMAAVSLALSWDLYPLPDAHARLERIPKHGPGFTSQDEALSTGEREILGKVGLIHRHYRLGGQEFWLTVMDGTKDRHAVHDPRYCFAGAGRRIVAEQLLPLPEGEARLLKMTDSDGPTEAVFWFSDGNRRYASLPRYWWLCTWRRMTLGRSGPEPLLVVLQFDGQGPANWPRFLDGLLAVLPL